VPSHSTAPTHRLESGLGVGRGVSPGSASPSRFRTRGASLARAFAEDGTTPVKRQTFFVWRARKAFGQRPRCDGQLFVQAW